MLVKKSLALSLIFAVFLAGCSGGDGFGVGNGQDTTGSTTGDSTTDSTTDTGDSGTSTAASVSSVALATGADSMTADGSSQVLVRATVTDTTGTAVANSTVTFSTSAGTFLNGTNTATTNGNGEASVSLVSPTNLGAAVVSANSDGVIGTATVSFVAGNASTVSINAGVQELNFSASTSVSVEVYDANGHPVSGERVTFSVSTNASGGVLSSLSAETDVNGRASVNYVAGSVAGEDSITATLAGAQTATATVDVSASAVVLNSLAFVEPNALGFITADGSSSTLLRATLLDTNSAPVEGVAVSFSTSVGDFTTAASGLTTATVNTDSNGNAEVLLFSRTTVDTARVDAAVGGFNQSLTIDFVPDVADSANSSITSAPASLPADGASETTVTVALADSNGNPISDGTQVTLRTTSGAILSTNPTTISSGRAEFTLQSASASGTATLTVTEVNGLSGTVSFGSNSDDEAANIVLTAAQSALSVAGVGQDENTTINIEIVEVDGDPIDEDNWAASTNTARVSFVSRPNGGEFLSGVNAAGAVVDTQATGTMDVVTINGSAQINLQAGVLPGVVEIQVEALDQTGASYSNPVRAILSQVSIASGPAHTIVFSFPVTNAIENLNNATPRVPGFYRKAGGITVSDKYGNAVADNTVINLGVTDTVIVKGDTASIAAGSADLSVADVNDIELADDESTDFAAASVTRSGTSRGIQAQDRILAKNAQAEDKSRFVNSLVSDTITAQTTYSNSQANIDYVIGASLLGATIAGVDSDGNLTTGSAVTTDGLAQVRITYPADVDSIRTGAIPDIDTRSLPLGSGEVYLIAQASTSGATVIDSTSFNAIAGYTLTPEFTDLSGSGTVSVLVEDGGDTVRVPFSAVSLAVFRDVVGSFDACVDTSVTLEVNCTGALDWYSPGGLCIDRFITDEDVCNAGVNDSWVSGLTSEFNVTAYVGDEDLATKNRISSGASHAENTALVPVPTDTDGDSVNDFLVHPFTDAFGVVDVEIVVSGSPFLVTGDKATITVGSGDGSTDITVEIP